MKIVDPLNGDWSEPDELAQWGKACGPPLSQPWLSHIAFNSTGVDMLATARLLLPEFVDHEGGVFLGIQFTKDSFAQWMSVPGNMKDVESMINHVHIYDILGNDNKISEHDACLVAHLLKRCWMLALHAGFPGK